MIYLGCYYNSFLGSVMMVVVSNASSYVVVMFYCWIRGVWVMGMVVYMGALASIKSSTSKILPVHLCSTGTHTTKEENAQLGGAHFMTEPGFNWCFRHLLPSGFIKHGWKILWDWRFLAKNITFFNGPFCHVS